MFKQDEDALRFGALPLDHLFIQEYLPGAKGDDIKVYLYALYLSQHPLAECSLQEVAENLGMEKADVEASLLYWERRRLAKRIRDNPPEYIVYTALQQRASNAQPFEIDPERVAFEQEINELFRGTKRHLSPAEIDQAWDWVVDERMHLPKEVVLMLIAYMKSLHTNFKMKTAEAEAQRLCDNKVYTVEAAEAYFAYSRKIQEGASAILTQFNRRRLPTQDEMDLYRKWTEAWGFAHKAIIEACKETTKGEPSFGYLDGILSGLRERAKQPAGARSDSDVKQQLSDEKAENRELQEFAHSLGFRSATPMLRKTYARLCDQYGAEIVRLVADETYRAGGDLEKAEHTMERLHAQGMTTLEAVQAYFREAHRLNAALSPLLEACGQRGAPTVGDRTLYTKWINDWGFSDEMLLAAARQARSASKKLPYMDKILEIWRQNGVTTPEQAAAQPPLPAGGKKVSAQQYTQREYTDDQLNAFAAGLIEEARSHE